LNVAGLKSRLNTHKADISKGAKKADLIALLIQIETNLLQGKISLKRREKYGNLLCFVERKPTETASIPTTTTTMTTRRRKN